MVLPLAIALGLGAAGLGVSIFGASKSAKAAKEAQQAIARENEERIRAQNEGFTARLGATGAQTEAQIAAQQAMLSDQTRIAEAMRTGQRGAIEGQQSTLAALNDQQGGLRNIGYALADKLMARTSGAAMDQSREDWRTQAATLLDATNLAPLSGAEQPGGTGNDPYTQAALRRRAAEAAANIRSYGQKAAQFSSHAAPMQLVSNAIQDTETGIMPANMASKLLVSSAPTLLEPSQEAWRNTGKYGEAAMAASGQAGQGALGLADLQYKNSTDIANLAQSNANVTASNIAEQAKMNAEYKKAIAGIYSGVGNLMTTSAGYWGELPDFLKSTGSMPGSKAPEILQI